MDADSALQAPEALAQAALCSLESSPKLEIGSRHWVYVTHVIDPSNFYIRPVHLNSCIQCIETAQSNEAFQLKNGSLALFKNKNNKWIRGSVICENGGMYDMFAMDYGFIQKVPLKDVKKLMPHAAQFPKLVINACTYLCDPLGDTWSTDTIANMKEEVEGKDVQIVIKGGQASTKLTVAFVYPHDISFLFAFSKLSTFGWLPNQINVFNPMAYTPSQLFYNERNINIGDKLHVKFLMMAPSEGFYVAQTEEYKELFETKMSFQYFAKKFKKIDPYELEVGLPVCYFDNMANANRAIITEVTIPNKKVRILMVDSGTSLETGLLRLAKLDAKYLTQPAVAIHCKSSLCYNLIKYFRQGVEFDITVESLGKTFSYPHGVSVSSNGVKPDSICFRYGNN